MPAAAQVGGQGVAAAAADREDVPRVHVADGRGGEVHEGPREALPVDVGDVGTTDVPRVEPGELDREDRRLELVEAAVEAALGVDVALRRAVVAQAAQAVGQGGVVGRHGAAVSERAEVLARVEAPRAGVSEAAHRPAAVAGAVGLGGVLQHAQVVAPGDLQDRVHLGRAGRAGAPARRRGCAA